MKPTVLLLTCSSEAEADQIAAALLTQRLIACAKKIPVASQFRWHGTVKKANEIILLLESREDMFEAIELAVRKLHAHQTFVLMALPASRVSRGIEDWINQSLKT